MHAIGNTPLIKLDRMALSMIEGAEKRGDWQGKKVSLEYHFRCQCLGGYGKSKKIGARKKIVTVVVDLGLKYLQGELYKQ